MAVDPVCTMNVEPAKAAASDTNPEKCLAAT